MTNKYKPPTFDEFLDTSVRLLCDAVIRGGFIEMKKVFKYDICQWIHSIYTNGGFKSD